MPSHVILHIGLPKTGTTSLQRAFLENRERLASRGISYPLPAGSKWNAQHEFVDAFRRAGADGAVTLLEACRPQIEGCDRLLMSSEEFAGWPVPTIQSWKECLDRQFGHPRYRIHMCIRRWSDLVPSLWHQHVISGGLATLPEHVLHQLHLAQRTRQLGFERVAQPWIEIFGRDAVRIVPIERLTEAGEDLVVHAFRSLLDIDAGDLAGRYKSNRSLPPEQLELIRAVSVFGMRRHGKASRGVSFKLRHLLRGGDSRAVEASRIFEPLRADLVLDDQQPPFPEIERAAMRGFGDLMEGTCAGMVFPPGQPRKATYIRDIYWLDAGFRETIESLYGYAVSGPAEPRRPRRLLGGVWKAVRRRIRRRPL